MARKTLYVPEEAVPAMKRFEKWLSTQGLSLSAWFVNEVLTRLSKERENAK